MNKEELLKLSETLRGIAEGKKWEYKPLGTNKWLELPDADPITAIGDGWEIRLKPLPQPQQTEPYAELRAAHAAGRRLQHRAPGETCWSDCSVTDSKHDAYRFIWPVECYRIKPEPLRVPLCADDIKAGDEFLVGNNRRAWISINNEAITFGNGGRYSFTELIQYGWKIRSIGETEWRNCYKEVEQ